MCILRVYHQYLFENLRNRKAHPLCLTYQVLILLTLDQRLKSILEIKMTFRQPPSKTKEIDVATPHNLVSRYVLDFSTNNKEFGQFKGF